MASLENKAGNFVTPSIESAQAAMATAEMPGDLIAWLPDPAGENAYPIVTYTWIICYKSYDDAGKLNAPKEVLNFCLIEGQKSSLELGYIPLPESVVKKVQAALNSITVSAPVAAPAA
jgi:phosphate transport system substrate-binding protein